MRCASRRPPRWDSFTGSTRCSARQVRRSPLPCWSGSRAGRTTPPGVLLRFGYRWLSSSTDWTDDECGGDQELRESAHWWALVLRVSKQAQGRVLTVAVGLYLILCSLNLLLGIAGLHQLHLANLLLSPSDVRRHRLKP